MLHTELIKWYHNQGFDICNLTKFIEYEPAQCFKKFYEKAYKLRVDATRSNNKPLTQVTKITMNSSYGRMIMNPKYFSNTSVRSSIDPRRSALIKNVEHITDDLMIVDSKKHTIIEQYPLHIGKFVFEGKIFINI